MHIRHYTKHDDIGHVHTGEITLLEFYVPPHEINDFQHHVPGRVDGTVFVFGQIVSLDQELFG